MDTIRLSARLQAVASLVPQGARVIDVGTDHAMLPVYLAQTGLSSHVWASDIHAGPLQSAERLVRSRGVSDRVFLRQTNGLHGFSSEDADCVVIAGMGGETMISILAAAPWTTSDVLLILEPQSKQELLRRWLTSNGYVIGSERLVRDAGRLYPVFTASGGASPPYTEAEYHLGAWPQICKDPLLPEYLSMLQRRTRKAAPFDAGAEALLRELNIIETRLSDHA